MTLDDILTAKDGPTAISIANNLIDLDSELSLGARLNLHRRVEGLVGPSAYAFTPRVSNIWYDFYSKSSFKLAALSLAASQDQSYPCEKLWELRASIAKKVIDSYSIADIDFALSYILRDWNYFQKFASDPHGVFDLITRVKSWRPKEPKARRDGIREVPKYEGKPYVHGGKYDNWISMVRNK